MLQILKFGTGENGRPDSWS